MTEWLDRAEISRRLPHGQSAVFLESIAIRGKRALSRAGERNLSFFESIEFVVQSAGLLARANGVGHLGEIVLPGRIDISVITEGPEDDLLDLTCALRVDRAALGLAIVSARVFRSRLPFYSAKLLVMPSKVLPAPTRL